MQPITTTQYNRIKLTGLLVFIITAIFSTGYNNYDEHFQILEFCNYKMGYSSSSYLPWEFAAQIRPAIQPFIAFCISKTLETLGCYNPFHIAFILRLLMAMLSYLIITRLIKRFSAEFTTDAGRNIFILSCFFLWFVPYVGVRFSAENFSGILFFLATSLLIDIDNYPTRKKVYTLLIIGLLLGFSFFVRLQVCLAIFGLFIWAVFIKKTSLLNCILIGFGALIAILLSVLADYWLYDKWLFTPYNYFNVNLLQDKATEFGVSPWWQYFIFFIETAVPPLSVALLLFFLTGIKKKPLHILSLICVPFLIGHFLIGHKEMRFLFPICFAMIFLAVIGFETLLAKHNQKRFYKWIMILLLITNFGTLLYKMLSPAANNMKYYAYLYKYAQKEKTQLIALDVSPYNEITLETNFYKPKNIQVNVIKKQDEIKQILIKYNSNKTLFLSKTLTLPAAYAQYNMKRVYTPFPEWLLKFNINNWQERTDIWAIYEVVP